MLYCSSLDQFKSKLAAESPLICIDYGVTNLGISISDRNRAFSIPYLSLKSNNASINEIARIVCEQNICGVVIGYPVESSGEIGAACKLVESFTAKLAKVLDDIPYFYQDERLSTKMAQTLLKSTSLTRKQRDRVDDQVAATNILQTTLDRLKL